MRHAPPSATPHGAKRARGLAFWAVGLPILRAVGTLLTARRFVVQGSSMEPAFRHGDHLLIDRLSYRLRDPARGEIVVLRHPPNQGQAFIKRIVGLPGETVQLEAEGVMVDGELLSEPHLSTPGLPARHRGLQWALADDQYFVLGDQRADSWDSRRFGPVHRDQIVGPARLRYWPPARWSFLGRWPIPPPPASGPRPWRDS